MRNGVIVTHLALPAWVLSAWPIIGHPLITQLEHRKISFLDQFLVSSNPAMVFRKLKSLDRTSVEVMVFDSAATDGPETFHTYRVYVALPTPPSL